MSTILNYICVAVNLIWAAYFVREAWKFHAKLKASEKELNQLLADMQAINESPNTTPEDRGKFIEKLMNGLTDLTFEGFYSMRLAIALTVMLAVMFVAQAITTWALSW